MLQNPMGRWYDSAMEIASSIGFWLGMSAAALLCIAGIILSCVAFSGTWLVVAAAAITALLRDSAFPGWWTVLVFAVISGLIEVVEAVSGGWGVAKRGGSKLAGAAALVGGLLGMVLGTAIPIPILGSVIGMLAGSFGLAYLVEYKRLQNSSDAANIAFGAVMARVLMILLKTIAALGMSAALLIGILMSWP